MRCLLLFLKFPQPGQVKTRLAKDVGDVRAAQIYTGFVQYLLQVLKFSQKQLTFHLRLCFAPEERRTDFVRWLGSDYDYYAQKGVDLGERLQDACEQAFLDGFEHVGVVGSDMLDLDSALLTQAYQGIAQKGFSLGPTEDGGYYFIGFDRANYDESLFQGIAWSSDVVFEQTRMKMEPHEWLCLPLKADIDTVKDLDRLPLEGDIMTVYEAKIPV